MPNWNVKHQLKLKSLTNLGTYLQKHKNRKRKHTYFTTKTMQYLYIYLIETSSSYETMV